RIKSTMAERLSRRNRLDVVGWRFIHGPVAKGRRTGNERRHRPELCQSPPFLMTPNVSCRSAVKATAVARSMITAIRDGRPSPPESLRLLVQITDSGCFNRLRARPPLAWNQHQ